MRCEVRDKDCLVSLESGFEEAINMGTVICP